MMMMMIMMMMMDDDDDDDDGCVLVALISVLGLHCKDAALQGGTESM